MMVKTLHTDREGRKGTGIIWVIFEEKRGEDKHIMSRSYKKREIQLISI